VRWEASSLEAAAPTLAVVTPRQPGETASWKDLTVPNKAPQHTPAPVEFPRAASKRDAGLHILSDMAVTGGIIACVVLCMMTMLGVAIAGGASVPGVERATSAATWSMVLAAACIPWRDFLPNVPFAGVFSGYDAMAALSTAVDKGHGS